MNIFRVLREKIAKTRNTFIGKIAETLSLRPKVDEELMEDLEEILLSADIGPDLSMQIIDELRDEIRINNIRDSSEVQGYLLEIIRKQLISDYATEASFFNSFIDEKPQVILIIGVNGTGKTTSIGKIAKRFHENGLKVLLIAADTFRAAAIEQLTIWSERSGIPIFKKESGADPSGVIYDGLVAAKNQNIDIVLIDTAGRQHNKTNLMNELDKIGRTIQKVIPAAPHETLLVIDSTTGQNAISQATFFHKVVPLTGIILTKFDGTAKGGVVITVKNQLNIPIKLIGIGEAIDDLREFNATEFAEALFS
jgi:fused signal recognition particle receptor